jgi:hypothetical protein
MPPVILKEKKFTDNLSQIKTVIAKTRSWLGGTEAKLILGTLGNFPMTQAISACLAEVNLSPFLDACGIGVKNDFNDTRNFVKLLNLLKENGYITEAFAEEIGKNYPNPYFSSDGVINLFERGGPILSPDILETLSTSSLPVSSFGNLSPVTNFTPHFFRTSSERAISFFESPAFLRHSPTPNLNFTGDMTSSSNSSNFSSRSVTPSVFKIAEISLKKEALNGTQKNLIEGTLSFPLEDIAALESSEATKALNAIIQEHISLEEIAYFQAKDVWSSIKMIRDILSHPCPQNRTESYPYFGTPSNPNNIVYKNSSGNAAEEPKGLLCLTAKNDVTAPAVTKEAVVDYIHSLIYDAIKKQEEIRTLSLD